MNKRIADWLSFAIICVPVIFAAVLWPQVPDPMPSHWNASGEVDGYLPKPWGVAILPLTAVGMWVLFKIIPLVSPKGFRTDAFADVVRVFQLATVAFTALIGVLVLLEASGSDVHIEQVVLAATGILLAVIGNYLGKVRKNFFIGIRTPWTLASDEVWSRTHRLGGKLFVLAGLVMVFGSLLNVPTNWIIGTVLVCALYPVLHSFILYRRIEGFGNEDDATTD